MSDGRGVVRAHGLTRRFGEVTAVHPFELEIGPGGITGLLGPNGAGKSTLLRMLIGLVPAHGGTCEVDGQALTGDGLLIRERTTYAPGEIATYGELTAEQHLRWMLRGRDAGAFDRARALAAGFSLPLDRRVRGFSHGMKRQLLVAAAMAPDVRVRILDEPTEGLDPTRRHQVLDLLARDAESGTTVLLSSHHLGEVDRICDRLVFLRDGRVLDEEHTTELHRRLRRAVRIAWEHEVERDTVERALAAFDNVRVDSKRAVIYLDEDDPRECIRRVAVLDLPPPSSLTYGELTLQDLYRELYGKEGI